MALLILVAALWIIVLAPGLLRRRSERHSVGSIDHFHHQLHLLERTGPKLVSPAYRLQSVAPATGVPVGSSGLPAVSSMPGRPNLVLLKPVGDQAAADPDEVVDDAEGGHYLRVGPPEAPPVSQPSTINLADPERYRRQQQAKRRRDILLLTLGTTVVTGLLGLVPSLHQLWIATIIAATGLLAYVGLLVYAANVAPPRPAPQPIRTAARAGYPGAWDEEDEYPQRRVAAGR